MGKGLVPAYSELGAVPVLEPRFLSLLCLRHKAQLLLQEALLLTLCLSNELTSLLQVHGL